MDGATYQQDHYVAPRVKTTREKANEQSSLWFCLFSQLLQLCRFFAVSWREVEGLVRVTTKGSSDCAERRGSSSIDLRALRCCCGCCCCTPSLVVSCTWLLCCCERLYCWHQWLLAPLLRLQPFCRISACCQGGLWVKLVSRFVNIPRACCCHCRLFDLLKEISTSIWELYHPQLFTLFTGRFKCMTKMSEPSFYSENLDSI